ncbi:choice-of-anchor I family protein [Thioalkalicoccus limnaeus]|uniref:Choice-of-anchor I family protein n=1 Tax=Thioalkalicoccus limnaeus TaxID=120681 RepID=A0ABV4BIJ8_9GAMM
MKFTPMATALLACSIGASVSAAPSASPFAISITPLGTYATDIFDRSAAEIVAHDPKTQRLFVVNAESGQIDVLSIVAPQVPTKLFSLNLGTVFANGQGIVNSVAVHAGLVAAAVEAVPRTDPGRVVFFDAAGEEGLSFLADVEVGALPDALTFTPDGKRVLVANEGEPNDDYTIDPEGSVSIIDLPKDIARLTQDQVRTATFTKFNDVELDPAIRIFGPAAPVAEGAEATRTVAQNLEPEWITVSKDGRTAWVALQENNAIAVLDIAAGEFTAIHALGFKDHLLPGNELDVSDRDNQINITNWPVFGMYQPDTIANYQYRGRNYIVTANEGDARDWDGYSEVSRFRALSGSVPICADSERFNAFFANNDMGITNLDQLRDNSNMGRLNVTIEDGLRRDADGKPLCYEDIYAFGARSFSIWNDELELVWDSGSEFERITAEVYPEFFNSNHRENSFETRSDDKGPEPEGVVLAKLWGRDYAFIGLERVGGVMIYDITNPYAPQFVQYFNNRDFGFDPTDDNERPFAGDLGAEGLIVIEASKSPVPGVPLLVVANEVSGTTTLFRIDRERLVGASRPR